MCFQKAKWKREVVQDHKFDFVCLEDFRKDKVIIVLNYICLYLVVIKTILVYIADLWTAGILIIFNQWTSSILPKLSIHISKWIYVGCIAISFLLLAIDWRKARAIIASKDISYAFTSIITYRYFSLRSYSHYCFFYQINEQKTGVDKIAFFVFFTFKGWKRLLFAEAPRQGINAFTLYYLIQTNITKDWMNLGAYGNNIVERLAMALMMFTLLVFIISATKLLIAFILYIPLLLFYIRGNLKEYCCHKIDKRIDELLKKKSRKRMMQQRMIDKAVAKGGINNLKKKDKVILNRPRRQPTLPTLDDNYDMNNNNSLGNIEEISPLEQVMRNGPPPYDNRIPRSHNANFRPPPPPEFTSSGSSGSSRVYHPIQSVSARANSPIVAIPRTFYYIPPPRIPQSANVHFLTRPPPPNERFNHNYHQNDNRRR